MDDILITGSDTQSVTTLIQSLNNTFTLKDIGNISYFLGIQIGSLPNGDLYLSQQKYISDILSRANMQSAKSVGTPMTTGQIFFTDGSDQVKNVQLYRSIVGALQYATITRPEITYSVIKYVNSCMHH